MSLGSNFRYKNYLRSIKLKTAKFKELMLQLNEPIPASKTVNTVAEALEFAETIGYPVIVRPAFTMGGTGGGLCDTRLN